MLFSLRARLMSSYLLVALTGILLISLSANFLLENQFRRYVMTNLTRQNRQIVAQISQQYDGGNSWNTSNISAIGMNALAQGLIIKLQDTKGTVVWDARVHNNGLCEQMMMHMAQNMLSRYPNWKGNYIETKYPVMKNFARVGTVKIGYYGPFYFKDSDLAFINTLNRIIMGVTVLAALLAVFIGSYTAKRMSAPIARVIQTAQAIAGGDLSARSGQRTHITEINQLTAAINNLGQTLQQQENLRKQLTADVAHELRTPLATLQSHLEALIDGIWKPDQQRLQVCYDEILRVNRMVKDLEKLAKYESENMALEKTQFNLAELIRNITVNFEPEFRLKNVALLFAGENTMVSADRDKLSQVVINLISNSLKFTPAGGRVEVNLKTDAAKVQLFVKDNGIGIPETELPYIFERFYRVDKSRNRQTGGSGIGLAIVKAIVEAHQGNIKVTSAPGEGTVFELELPVV